VEKGKEAEMVPVGLVILLVVVSFLLGLGCCAFLAYQAGSAMAKLSKGIAAGIRG